MAGHLKELPWKRADTPPEGISLANKAGLKRMLLDEWLYKGNKGTQKGHLVAPEGGLGSPKPARSKSEASNGTKKGQEWKMGKGGRPNEIKHAPFAASDRHFDIVDEARLGLGRTNMMHEFDHHTPGHPYEIQEAELLASMKNATVNQPYMQREEGGTTWKPHATEFERRLGHTSQQPGRSAPKGLPFDPQLGAKLPDGRPASQSYWDVRFGKEPRVGELVSPDGFTAVAMEHTKGARNYAEKQNLAASRGRRGAKPSSPPCGKRTPAVGAKNISPGLPITFKVIPKPELVALARKQNAAIGGEGGGGGGNGFTAAPPGPEGGCPALPKYLYPPPYAIMEVEPITPKNSTNAKKLFGVPAREGLRHAAVKSPDYPDPKYNKSDLPPGYPWSHKGNPEWKEKAPYYTAHRTRGDHEIAQMQGQGNLLKEVREWSGADMNPYDSGVGPMQVGYDMPKKARNAGKPVEKNTLSRDQKVASDDLPNTFKTLVDKREGKAVWNPQEEMSTLRRENDDLRRMITKRMDALPTENPNQVAKMKGKLERATPFGRARRRLGDQDHAILAGQGNLMKEARTWSGAEMNAYDTTEPGPLTKGYEHHNRPRADPLYGDKFDMGVSQQFGSADLPSTFKTSATFAARAHEVASSKQMGSKGQSGRNSRQSRH